MNTKTNERRKEGKKEGKNLHHSTKYLQLMTLFYTLYV